MAVAVSGDRVVVVGEETDSSCYHARVDVLTTAGRLLAVQRHRDPADGCTTVQTVAVSPDGRYAAAAGYGGTTLTEAEAVMVDLRTGRQRWWGASRGLGLGAAGFAVTWHGNQVLVGESAYVSPANAFLPGLGLAEGGTFQAVPRVVAYDGATGTQLWSTLAAPTSTRLGAVFSLAVSPDAKVLYASGEEGPSLGFADAYAGGERQNPVGYADGFVRAIDLETHQELWTGRLPTDPHEVGVNGSAFLNALPVPGGVVVVGRTTLTEWTGNAGRHNYTRGVLLRFTS
jgi:hypothetical protein